jgi:hypothetical protein
MNVLSQEPCTCPVCGSHMEISSDNQYKNLWIYEISAPRTFGEKFAQNYITQKCSKLKKPNKKLDPNYSGDYDLWLDGIRIEVKASRAVDKDEDKPLHMKALPVNTKKKYIMNFQQLKPNHCDVFVWVAVFTDEIITWVISSKDVLENKFYSKGQHRGNKGNEGQLHINQENIKDFSKYKLKDDILIESMIIDAFNRNNS